MRKAKSDDLDQIYTLEKKCFKGNLSYSKQQLQYLILTAHSVCFVYEQNQCIEGFIIILYRRNTRVAGIETIDVDPRFRKKGIGRQLLRAAEQDIKKRGIQKIQLEVSIKNKGAIDFYKTEGFKKTATLPEYYMFYHDGSRDAFRMVKKLS